ncbi:Arm DNA-binding domain-containing protein [Phyllobacterium sp. LjRoot231]|uniref:integrase arm-type DNA-binding domain-containing protein n=1 Tax=Phyllobacterium sp. LjRoot231 TaxID=3342289 RepID=UPI003ECC2625
MPCKVLCCGGKKPTGRASWAYRYRSRVDGKVRKLTIGEVLKERKTPNDNGFTLSEAVKKAKAAYVDVDSGRDPAMAKAAARPSLTIGPAPVIASNDTVKALGDAFIEDYAKVYRKRWQEVDRQFRVEIYPDWEHRLATDITFDDVTLLLRSIRNRIQEKGGKGVTANRVKGTLSCFFNWLASPAGKKRIQPQDKPCAGVDTGVVEESRDRLLSDDEIRLFWLASSLIGYPFGKIDQLALLTG